ncbi:hypothetical protein [Caballeronia fortuita]|uniref:hypothetical protein n=1 Tax=Caballeronia fortuita TaxID=1777138 RepID=UPI0012FDACEC|nr:hypothetical protein [Caballeronia fortuita]
MYRTTFLYCSRVRRSSPPVGHCVMLAENLEMRNVTGVTAPGIPDEIDLVPVAHVDAAHGESFT